MSVSPEFRDFALEQLGRVTPVTSRRMFGGIGLYAGGLFFAVIDDDVLYLKVDDEIRGDFDAIGARPFQPMADKASMNYAELPADRLEDMDELRRWVEMSLAAAARAKQKKPKRR